MILLCMIFFISNQIVIFGMNYCFITNTKKYNGKECNGSHFVFSKYTLEGNLVQTNYAVSHII